MFDLYNRAALAHLHVRPQSGDAAQTVLRRENFSAAVAAISTWEGYAPTPLYRLTALAQGLRLGEVLYKDEGPRFGLGSFKALGAAYAAARVVQGEISRMLGEPVKLADICAGRHLQDAASITLACATDGNHGRSLAWGARRFGTRCRIYVHADVSAGRVQAIRAYGAEVIQIRGDYDASVRIVREDAEANGWLLVSDTSWDGYTETPRNVMLGYGVMTHEINDQLGRAPTHIVLQGGVGGLAASVCAVMRQCWEGQAPRVIIVEPELAACLYASARAGEARSIGIGKQTIMAGLSCGEPSVLAWSILREEANDFLTIPDSLIGPTMRLLARPLGNDPSIQAGESAVAGLAAVIAVACDDNLRSACGFDEQARVLLIGSEGVTDPDIYARILATPDG